MLLCFESSAVFKAYCVKKHDNVNNNNNIIMALVGEEPRRGCTTNNLLQLINKKYKKYI